MYHSREGIPRRQRLLSLQTKPIDWQIQFVSSLKTTKRSLCEKAKSAQHNTTTTTTTTTQMIKGNKSLRTSFNPFPNDVFGIRNAGTDYFHQILVVQVHQVLDFGLESFD